MSSQSSRLQSVPEFIETTPTESLQSRTDSLASFGSLGPPDLVHLNKIHLKSQLRQGSYHFVSGVDASSSASIAAYMNLLTYDLGRSEGWFSGGKQTWKIESGTYCCYNAFSRVDLRVDVRIPGSVESYAVDSRGQKLEATADLWTEAYLCGVIRALLYSDEEAYKIVGYRKLNPVDGIEAEQKFLDVAEKLFFKAWTLGSEPEVQIANSITNYLVSALLKYGEMSGQYSSLVNLFEKLRTRDPEVAALLAKTYIDMDEEVRAIKLLHETMQQLPNSHQLLNVQAQFLVKKDRRDLALLCAKRAVNNAPSEFTTWARLTEIYISLGDYESALLTLNSCPMFTYHERDAHRMPPPARQHMPVPSETLLDELAERDPKANEVADAALLRLPAPGLRGTFMGAYGLLTKLVGKIGWDELLRTRSTVFVMEEEYRHQKEEPAPGDSGVGEGEGEGVGEGVENGEEGGFVPGIPTINIHEPTDGEATPENGEVAEESGKDKKLKKSPFQHKRLCERWLDNLFMVLYEDLRVYTIWRAEITHFRQQQLTYRKTAAEWEILGDLAARLQHRPESVEAYQKCLETKYSPKAWRALLQWQLERGEWNRAVVSVMKLAVWSARWYTEFSPDLIRAFRLIVAAEGATKVNSVLSAMNLPKDIRTFLNNCDLSRQYKSVGHDM
ncbi:chaps-domain-containing protein [Saitoella complicata NRRL Y-17804]|uniref:Uncharacterized protein n=1 Tax=Saitoella complicata (strain BCRC 22490 / CBS 7301 / JCM 7358 / NBRC 10748 / NRRL Y-17804) TaxID=698492 RepID=A0A0E9NBV9_SAICN|nr:chaps-domain-containing protein [Saitoella complicata NRRL Y-17804]ODQ51549.1 chaps-domain-containing protein [Saitoella complicata NRRL Y-17804]GAO47298.1 hypothetical protein G7K_1507-t1 [Saitoella complicata NRRL Y-17804]